MVWAHVPTGMAISAALARSMHPAAAPPVDAVGMFGFVAAVVVVSMFVSGGPSRRSRMVLATGLLGTSVYGFLEGAWPLGIVQMVWSVAVFKECRRRATGKTIQIMPRAMRRATAPHVSEARISRMFG